MFLQVVLVLEGFAALPTLELAITGRVGQHVALESVDVHKGLVANVTDLVPARHVCGHVPLELRLVREAVVALWAGEVTDGLLVAVLDVFLQGCDAFVGAVTVGAVYRFAIFTISAT